MSQMINHLHVPSLKCLNFSPEKRNVWKLALIGLDMSHDSVSANQVRLNENDVLSVIETFSEWQPNHWRAPTSEMFLLNKTADTINN